MSVCVCVSLSVSVSLYITRRWGSDGMVEIGGTGANCEAVFLCWIHSRPHRNTNKGTETDSQRSSTQKRHTKTSTQIHKNKIQTLRLQLSHLGRHKNTLRIIWFFSFGLQWYIINRSSICRNISQHVSWLSSCTFLLRLLYRYKSRTSMNLLWDFFM